MIDNQVIIEVWHGLAYVVSKPPGIEVVIRDLDSREDEIVEVRPPPVPKLSKNSAL